ncbi:Gfo/Idh/MocA family oxidoreductase [bacterium]|nr:Gfo/Idh/MocA family oxidoreductase [bacterium]
MADKTVTLIVDGAGGRGSGCSRFALEHPDRLRVVGVAEPDDYRRERMAKTYGISPENQFKTWEDMAAREQFADAVFIATQDAMHADPSVAFADKGYDILLEKPMAPNEADCRRIVESAKRNGALFGVCHVLRYTSYTRKLIELIRSGAIGDVVSLNRIEPVGYWHQAHSFVRGHWRNEQESSFMLLAKSCHDLDWVRYVMGVRCTRVASFGSLKHFCPEEAPEGAADRCLDCPAESNCPYSAKRIYLGFLEKGRAGWPVDVLTPNPTPESVQKALREGPYGRCVYRCDNDVVDNQVVSMQFEGGRTANFTMTAFTKGEGRRTSIFGTRGEIYGDDTRLWLTDFLTDKTTEIDTAQPDATALGGHGGGDYGIMGAFVRAVARRDQSLILSGPDETLESHVMVFRAEQSRREGRMVEID